MRRREYLAAASASTIPLIGGCIGETGEASNTDTGEEPSDNAAEERPPDARRKLTLRSVSTTPDGSPISFDIEVDDPWITPSSTATFEITATNTGDEPREVGPSFYKAPSSLWDRAGIVVYNYRAKDFDIETYSPPCFSDSNGESYVRTSQFDDEEKVVFTREKWGRDTIEAGSDRTGTCIVADDPTVEECFPPADYRFENQHGVGGSATTLRFELRIESV